MQHQQTIDFWYQQKAHRNLCPRKPLCFTPNIKYIECVEFLANDRTLAHTTICFGILSSTVMHNPDPIKIVEGKPYNWTKLSAFADRQLEQAMNSNQILIQTNAKGLNTSFYNVQLPNMDEITSYDESDKLLFLLACILILTLTLCICCLCCSCCEFPRCPPCPQRYRYAVSVPVSDRRHPRRYRQDDDDATIYSPSNV